MGDAQRVARQGQIRTARPRALPEGLEDPRTHLCPMPQAIDVVNNIPFMRTVRPRQRVEMTTVFSTWREMSALLAPAIAAAILLIAPFWTFYLLLATLAFITAAVATHLPRRI